MRVSQKIQDVEKEIVNAVLANDSVDKLRDELQTLHSVYSAQEAIVSNVKKHFKNQLPTRIELLSYTDSLLDNAPQEVIDYRDEVLAKVEARIEFQFPMPKGRGMCHYG